MIDTYKFYIGNSQIIPNQKGLFANRNFSKYAFITQDFTQNGRNTGFFETDFRQSEATAMINHSDTPNTKCGYSAKHGCFVRYAIRDIAQGEEILADYREVQQQAQAIGKAFLNNIMAFQ